ncbi:unnamed protein product [Adineta ricciae]|uniref:Uncharacterized protein n=1 Tax=Adineta ricciae TaxID=249248 RepID=A0A815B5H8_ADIRI|nr:unnamed protein product [Adineta ricciae]CAF1265227.1 unnamed protein product [Adineta ricciae]
MILIDIDENVHVEEILELAKRRFGLKVHGNGPSETSVVLAYNGFDLKPQWCVSDLSIPSGAIIHCIYREVKAPELYVYCGFDQHILKIYDSSITIETKIGTIRRIISQKIGLPLSTFCLETYTGTQRLYDEMKLINYDIKIHDHVYLKVWQGFDKFIAACVKNHVERVSPDELARHYQAQVALYIASFYGHLELATYALRQGARSDRPVGEPPSRQWSANTAVELFPETLRCPIHIAVERGYMLLVNCFVQNSILCTQARDPITGNLPYRMALSFLSRTKDKEQKSSFTSIYFFLYNKQYYLRIPLNADGEYISNLLASKNNTNAVHRLPAHPVYTSLPLYCRIISWCERAREKTWKRFGGQFSTPQTKRVYPEAGLLGYKVLIDGYNNTFEVPPEQLQLPHSRNASQPDVSTGFSEEDREKILRTKNFMQSFHSDDRRRFKQIIASHHIGQSSISLPSDIIFNNRKNSVMTPHPPSNLKSARSIVERNHSTIPTLLPSSSMSNPSRNESKSKKSIHTPQPTSRTSFQEEKDKHVLPMIMSSMSNQSPTISALSIYSDTIHNKDGSQSVMSSADAYIYSSSRLAHDIEERNAAKRRELFTQIEQSVKEVQQKQPPSQIRELTAYSANRLASSLPNPRGSMIDIDSCLALPDHPVNYGTSSIKSRHDLNVRQAAFKPYERYASASTRSTAINCIQEANHFKRKSWTKQVNISKEMVKHKVHRRLARANGMNRNSAVYSVDDSTRTISPRKSNAVEVN